MKRLAFILGLACAGAAQGAPFADPTRPPVLAEPVQGSAATSEGPRLESILIAPDRRIAVISGQQVVVGAKVAGGEVMAITESEVVIRGADGLQSLKLVPQVRQLPAGPKRGATQ